MNYSELNIYKAIKAPVQIKLEEILKLLKKDDLLSFAEEFGTVGRSKMNKDKLVSELYKHFSNPVYLKDALLAATKEELSLFRKLLEVPYSEKGEATYGKLRYLTAMGAVFLFQQDNTIYMVVPEEIKELILSILLYTFFSNYLWFSRWNKMVWSEAKYHFIPPGRLTPIIKPF